MWSNLKSAVCRNVLVREKWVCLASQTSGKHNFSLFCGQKNSLPASQMIWLVKIARRRRRRWWQWGSGEAVTPQSTLQDAFSHWDAHPLTLIHHQCLKTIPEAFSLSFIVEITSLLRYHCSCLHKHHCSSWDLCLCRGVWAYLCIETHFYLHLYVWVSV